MKLQDIITTNRRMDVAMINNDDELSRQIQNILIKLNLLNPPADGVFGPLSTGALHRFQAITNCG
ncbi:MAG: peptidoglycan-binding domain-containing protein, partial [Microcoleaceae cyanobacterium]